MGKNIVQQVEVVTTQTARKQGTFVQKTAFFDPSGNPVTVGVVKAASVAAVATANATDLATAQALANQLKTTVNSVIANLKTAGLMVSP